MNKSLTILAAALILTSVPALANSSNFGVMVNLAVPLPMVPVVPMDANPVRVLPATPGISLEWGIPYDLVFYNNRYYARQEGAWFCSGRANGPWQPVAWRYLPDQIRNRYETVRERRPVMYGEHEGRYQEREHEQYRHMVRYDSREGREGSRFERGRENERHDHDDRR
jgi:hypothetical protein